MGNSKIMKNMENLKKEFEKQNLTKEVTPELTHEVTENINKENFVTISQLDFSEISNWELKNDEFEFCKSKIEKIINHTANSYLFIGKEFEEIFQKFSKQGSENGIYEKLVDFLGFNPKTVRRWRKRYSLFQLAKTQSEKELIAAIPTTCIEKLSKLSTSEINNILSDNNTKEELIKAINTEKLEYKEKNIDEKKKVSDTMSESYNFSEDKILDIFGGFNEKMDKLTIDKKEKVNKLIASIEKILNNN